MKRRLVRLKEFLGRRRVRASSRARAHTCLGAMLAFIALALPLSGVSAQEPGRIAGRVTAIQSGGPVGEVQVFIPGAGIGTLTRQNGNFIILEIAPGTYEIRAERIGFAAGSQQVTVTAGATAEVDFQLTTQVLGLDEIVVTGTAGASRRREIGNTINQINTAELPNKPIEVIDMLQAAAPRDHGDIDRRTARRRGEHPAQGQHDGVHEQPADHLR